MGLLSERQSSLRTPRAALELLREKLDDETLISAMVSSTSTLQDKLAWVNVEVHAPDIPKNKRFFPIALDNSDQAQQVVDAVHRKFFEQGWEAATVGWFTASFAIDFTRFIQSYFHESAQQSTFVVLALNNMDPHLLANALTGKNAAYAPAVFSINPAWTSRRTVRMRAVIGNYSREWAEDAIAPFSGILHGRIQPFLDWIASYPSRIEFYVAYEHSRDKDARLYGAFTEGASPKHLLAIPRLSRIMNKPHVYNAVLRSVNPDPLCAFWESTTDWFDNCGSPHDWSTRDNENYQHWTENTFKPLLSQRLGKIPEHWDTQMFFEAVKSVCGIRWMKRYPINVCGAVLLVLMGIYNTVKCVRENATLLENYYERLAQIDWAGEYETDVEMYTVKSVASHDDIARALFLLGEALSLRKADGALTLRSVLFRQDRAGIVLCLGDGHPLALCEKIMKAQQLDAEVNTTSSIVDRLISKTMIGYPWRLTFGLNPARRDELTLNFSDARDSEAVSE